jgi:transglutaminase-like putative cysteine protease
MRYKLGCSLSYRVKADEPLIFNIEAQCFGNQYVEEENLRITPSLTIDRWTMPESGNRYFRINASPGPLVVEYDAIVSLDPSLENPANINEVPLARMPLWLFPHLYPSRYCQSDRLERFARSTFGDFSPGYDRVNAICNWIHDYVSYEGGVSDAMTSAFDTVTQRAGVCRDFSHLAIAICRSLGVPARYISAYAFKLAPPDFHAVFEAYLSGPNGDGWYLFDATRLADPAGLIRIGIGRDASDVAFCSPYGPIEYDKPDVWIDALDHASESTTQAVLSQPG